MNRAPILYAEDDEHDVFFLQHAFQTVGITNLLQIARAGRGVIDYFLRPTLSEPATHPLPCLVMLDLKMPRVSGMDVLAWLRNNSNQCYFVINPDVFAFFSAEALLPLRQPRAIGHL